MVSQEVDSLSRNFNLNMPEISSLKKSRKLPRAICITPRSPTSDGETLALDKEF